MGLPTVQAYEVVAAEIVTGTADAQGRPLLTTATFKLPRQDQCFTGRVFADQSMVP